MEEMEKLTGDLQVDVTIVGGGITGITSAYVLAKEGYQVVLIDAGMIFNGTTGHTTAKITAQHDLIYAELMSHFGQEQAKLYYEAACEAQNFIKNTISELQIECEYQEEDAYIYATDASDIAKIEQEALAYEKLGIDGGITQTIELPLPIKSALVMNSQAQFHPLAYLKRLVAEFLKMGGEIYERTVALDIIEGKQPTVVTKEGHRIISEHVIIATHFPFYDGLGEGAYFSRMYPERSYVLAVKMKQNFPKGMYLSAGDPKRSLRSVTIGGEQYVLLGGESHKTGQGISTIQHYEALVQYGKEYFGLKEIAYRWSAQDLVTLDKVPYIGRLTKTDSNIFVATGYRKWGMTNSTVAALLFKDLIKAKENPYEVLYSPSRFVAEPSIKQFLKANADVAKHFVRGKLEIVPTAIDALKNDEAGFVLVDGKKAGVYKDQEGKIYMVDTTCKHMGCEVEWNSGERTWDCPCHGSRYGITGEVYEGPAKQPLDQVKERG